MAESGQTLRAEAGRRPIKSPDAFRTISEVATDLDVPPHVLRFWETKFNQIKPLKRGGGRRYYRPEDVALLRRIRSLLYVEGYTIKGVQRLLKESGVRSATQVGNMPPPGAAAAAVTVAARVGKTAEQPAEPQVLPTGDVTDELQVLKDDLLALKQLLAPHRND